MEQVSCCASAAEQSLFKAWLCQVHGLGQTQPPLIQQQLLRLFFVPYMVCYNLQPAKGCVSPPQGMLIPSLHCRTFWTSASARPASAQAHAGCNNKVMRSKAAPSPDWMRRA